MGRTVLPIVALIALGVPLCQSNEFADMDYQACLSDYMSSIQGMTSLDSLCPKLRRLLNCIINGETYANVPLTEDTINHLEMMVDSILSKLNVHCDIDIRSMVHHIAPSMPSGQQRCLNQYTESVAQMDIASMVASGNLFSLREKICPLIKTEVTCLMASINHKDLRMSLSAIEANVKGRLNQMGISCGLDFKKMADEAVKEKDRSQGSRRPTVADLHMVHNAVQQPDSRSKPIQSVYHTDQAFQYCYHEYDLLVSGLQVQDGGSVCNHFDRLYDCMEHSGHAMTQQDINQLNHVLNYLRSKKALLKDCDMGDLNMSVSKNNNGGRNSAAHLFTTPRVMLALFFLGAWTVFIV